MSDLTDLIERWMNSSLELREAESLINLLIVDNKRLSKLEGSVQGVFDDLFEGELKVRLDGDSNDWVDADEWLTERLINI